MRVYPTATRNYLVKAVNADGVLYDVVFPINKETPFDKKEREILGVGPDVPRNTNHNLYMATDKFAVMVARHGHYLQTPNKAAQKVIREAIQEHFNG